MQRSEHGETIRRVSGCSALVVAWFALCGAGCTGADKTASIIRLRWSVCPVTRTPQRGCRRRRCRRGGARAGARAGARRGRTPSGLVPGTSIERSRRAGIPSPVAIPTATTCSWCACDGCPTAASRSRRTSSPNRRRERRRRSRTRPSRCCDRRAARRCSCRRARRAAPPPNDRMRTVRRQVGGAGTWFMLRPARCVSVVAT